MSFSRTSRTVRRAACLVAAALVLSAALWLRPPALWAEEDADGPTVSPLDVLKAREGAPLPENPSHGDTWTEPVTGMRFVYLAEGCFTRGTPVEEAGRYPDEGPAHKVCVRGFWFGEYPVTNARYRVRRPEHSSRDFDGVDLDGDTQPAVFVSWEDALAYTQWLTALHENRVAFWLPSESEWEYACRAGTQTARFWGESPELQCEYANGADLAAKRRWSAWDVAPCYDGYAATSPVGSFRPNPWGLYDMLGNVWEWCTDWKGKYPAGRLWNPTGPILSNYGRVVRGGSWDNDPVGLRCGNRSYGTPEFVRYNIGFRVGAQSLRSE